MFKKKRKVRLKGREKRFFTTSRKKAKNTTIKELKMLFDELMDSGPDFGYEIKDWRKF